MKSSLTECGSSQSLNTTVLKDIVSLKQSSSCRFDSAAVLDVEDRIVIDGISKATLLSKI